MTEINGRDVRKVTIACDAGMGSSVMVASQMRNRLKKYDVTVDHVPVNSIPADAQVVVCHAGLADRARGIAPGAVVVPTTAVQAGQQGQYVFVVKNDQTADLRTVTVARTVANESIIQQGLSPGETVVTDGQLRLVPGSRVSIKSGPGAKVAP